MYWTEGYYMGGMHALGWLFWAAILVALAGLWNSRRGKGGGVRETPREILRRRFANGEIGVDDYERRSALLEKDAQPH